MRAKPLVVVAGDGPWPGGAVEALLRGQGYELERVAEAELVNTLHRKRPDLILLSPGSNSRKGLSLCRSLSERSWVVTTPVFYLCTHGRAEEVSALEAGAWDAFQCPPDPATLLPRIRNAIEIRRKADDGLNRGLIDSLTGCYNREGLIRHLKREMLFARRHQLPLACLVVALDPLPEVIQSVGDPDASESAFTMAADVLRTACRRTDILAHHTDLEFSIVAPGTNRDGSRRLASRLASAFEQCPVRARANGTARPFRAVVGSTVRTSWSSDETAADTLLWEASQALELATAWGAAYRIYTGGADPEADIGSTLVGSSRHTRS